MTKHATLIAAISLIAASVVYSIVALATGHSARAKPPPDLSTSAVGLPPLRAVAWMVEEAVTIVDVRPESAFAVHHLPGALSRANAGASDFEVGRPLLIVAASDKEAAALVGAITAGDADAPVRYLEGGVPAWYLAFELPTPLFNVEPPPRGWQEARAIVRAWLRDVRPGNDEVRRAVEQLAAADYGPTGLGRKEKPKAGTQKKKISGGCG